jgi:hypothetical protein
MVVGRSACRSVLDERHHQVGCVLVVKRPGPDKRLPGSELEGVCEGGVHTGTSASADVPSASEQLVNLEQVGESGRGHLAHDAKDVDVAQDVVQEGLAPSVVGVELDQGRP